MAAASDMPLAFSTHAFQPITRRTFAPNDTLRLYARAFWKRNVESARVSIQIVGGEARPAQTIELAGRPIAGGAREATLDGELPLGGLRPGAYVLRIEASLPSGAACVRQIPFEIQ